MTSKCEYSYEDFLHSGFWEGCDDVEQLSKKKILSVAYKFYMNLIITENIRMDLVNQNKFLLDENYALCQSNERLAGDNKELDDKFNSLSYNRTVLIISISTVIITIVLVVGALIPIL